MSLGGASDMKSTDLKHLLIFFDDWGGGAELDKSDLGEKKAFDEFLKDNPQLNAEEFGSYHHTEIESRPVAKIFLVTKL
jgi:hypothetical protein